MKEYEKYKTSKFLWFDKLPENWIEGKIKYLFEISRGRVISQLELKPEAKYPVYSSQTKNDGCLGYIETFDYEGEMLTWTTDGANAGSVFQRKGQFNCTNVCGILIPKQELGLRYYFYYVDFIAQFYKRPDTNGAKIMSNEMAEIHCFIPSLEEQTAIAAFLDYKTSLIDATIEKKKRLIKLLKEKRQAVINEAVTKGLNPNAPMKDNGVEWLGEIPEHWKVKKLKHVVSCNDETLNDKTDKDFEINYIEIGDVSLEKGVENYTKMKFSEAPSRARRIVKENDIILSTVRTYLKAITKVNSNYDNFIASTGFAVLRSKFINPDFLGAIVKTENFIDEVISLSVGVSYPAINSSILLDISIPLPPEDEQLMISDKIDKEFISFQNLISKIEIAIEKLQTYRQSLISEAVTGKIDVRDWEREKN